MVSQLYTPNAFVELISSSPTIPRHESMPGSVLITRLVNEALQSRKPRQVLWMVKAYTFDRQILGKHLELKREARTLFPESTSSREINSGTRYRFPFAISFPGNEESMNYPRVCGNSWIEKFLLKEIVNLSTSLISFLIVDRRFFLPFAIFFLRESLKSPTLTKFLSFLPKGELVPIKREFVSEKN